MRPTRLASPAAIAMGAPQRHAPAATRGTGLAAHLLQLQRSHGNQAVQQLLGHSRSSAGPGGVIQAKRMHLTNKEEGTYKYYQAKGAALWKDMEDAAKAATPKDVDTTDAWKKRYTTEFSGIGTGNVTVSSGPPTIVAPYTNVFSGELDALTAAKYNFRDLDKQVETKVEPLPNSEVLWHQHRLALEKVGKSTRSPGDLTHITRAEVGNDETCKVVSIVHEGAFGSPREFKPGTPDFEALLYTPNVRPAAFMLKDHPSLKRTITRITTTPGEQPPSLIGPYYIEKVKSIQIDMAPRAASSEVKKP
jgi:hypothetical protein